MRSDVVVVLEEGEEINRALLTEGERIAQLLGGKVTSPGEPFRLMLFAHTDRGAELAPLTARKFDAAAVTDCFDIRVREGRLYYARHVCGGQFEQEVSFAHPPEFASLSLDSLAVHENPVMENVVSKKT